MLIEDLPAGELGHRLRREGVNLVTGACTFHVRSAIRELAAELATMYGAYPIEEEPCIVDASLRLSMFRAWRRPLQQRVKVWIDDVRPLEALGTDSSYVAFESALNWATALRDVAPLLMHAAVVERDGFAAILPAPAGSGKSTLCAALVCNGWRLFSDEMAIFTDDGKEIAPNPRPISLKNRAIEIMRCRSPDVYIGPVITGTPKGDVAYLRAPRDAVERCRETAPPVLVIRPAYREGELLSIKRLGNVEAFELLTGNAVNYASMLRFGFETMVALVERCGCYELAYSDIYEAIDAVDRLHRQHAGH